MPYNNTPIAPSKEVSGQVSLPLARVQKIINADPERLHTSKNSAFAIALATEMFIQHIATTTHNVVKTERKPRRNIQYRDVATAVAKTDNLEFLVDVVPKTTTYREFKKKRAEKEKAEGKDAKENGDGEGSKEGAKGKGKVNGSIKEAFKGKEVVNGKGVANGKGDETEEDPEAMDVDGREEPMAPRSDVEESSALVDAVPPPPMPPSDDEDDGAAMQIEMEMRGPRAAAKKSPETVRRPSGFTAINGSK